MEESATQLVSDSLPEKDRYTSYGLILSTNLYHSPGHTIPLERISTSAACREIYGQARIWIPSKETELQTHKKMSWGV